MGECVSECVCVFNVPLVPVMPASTFLCLCVIIHSLSVCVCACVHACVCVCACMCVCVRVCMHVCVHACVYVCMCACMCVCIPFPVCVYTTLNTNSTAMKRMHFRIVMCTLS